MYTSLALEASRWPYTLSCRHHIIVVWLQSDHTLFCRIVHNSKMNGIIFLPIWWHLLDDRVCIKDSGSYRGEYWVLHWASGRSFCQRWWSELELWSSQTVILVPTWWRRNSNSWSTLSRRGVWFILLFLELHPIHWSPNTGWWGSKCHPSQPRSSYQSGKELARFIHRYQRREVMLSRLRSIGRPGWVVIYNWYSLGVG